MVISDFLFARAPEIHFGTGKINELPKIISNIGRTVLLVTGSRSFHTTTYYENLMSSLRECGITVYETSVHGEPSPQFVDETTQKYREENIEVVLGIGGGSAVDGGKAISAMLTQEGSIKQFLEGMETHKHNGVKIPYIAVPTSSGTGSEATKNAVISEIGERGFKKSLRHNNFVPDIAVVDPELTLSCPPAVTAACGLDALTQLLEAYVSTEASPMTDALSLSGIEHFKEGFIPSFLNGAEDLIARKHMSYASLISGIVLANAGLGVVHGFASPIGGYFDIPHGVVCGTLLSDATRINLETMFKDPEKYSTALMKYARAGAILSGNSLSNIKHNCESLIKVLDSYTKKTDISTLGKYGINKSHIEKIVDKTNNKNSPVKLDRNQIASIIEARI